MLLINKPEYDVYKQTEVIVCEPLLPQEYEMKYITKCESMLHNDKIRHAER